MIFLGLLFHTGERTPLPILSHRLSHVSCHDSEGAPSGLIALYLKTPTPGGLPVVS